MSASVPSGNILSLAVALRPKVRGSSFSVFLGALAIADNLVLWAQSFLLNTYYRVSQNYCVSRPFLLMYPEAQANWIIAGTRKFSVNYQFCDTRKSIFPLTLTRVFEKV